MRSKLLVLPGAIAVAIAMAITTGGCGASATGAAADSIEVTDAWSRQPAEGQMVGVAYAMVTNSGDTDVRIVSASSSASDDVQLHETLMSDEGAMSMQEVEDFVVPAGGTFLFEPGGPHIMMMGIDASSFPTTTVDVTVNFEDGTSASFDAQVRPLAGGADEDSDEPDHDHGDQHEGDHGGDEQDHDSMDESSMDMNGTLDASALHAVDEELSAGTFEPERQIEVVETYVSFFSSAEKSSGNSTALTALENLLVQLHTGDADSAATAATLAHDAVHAVEAHEG